MIDLAIVGAGAAGIATAREARERGLTCVILEASERIGGRAQTIDWRGHKLDLGATWLHSTGRNPLARLAEQRGIAIDRSPTAWRKQYKNLGYSQEEQVQSWAALETFAERLRQGPPGDQASGALEPRNEWNGFLEALNGYLNGTSLANTSAEDFIAFWDASENSNWRLPDGYGALVSALADGLDIRTGCAVRRIDWGGPVRLNLANGAIVEAGQAIVAVPTNILAAGEIAFNPRLDERLQAAAQLPLGRVEKLFLSLADPESAPINEHLIGSPRAADTGSYMLRPLGLPAIECFFGGDWLEGTSGDDLAAKARDELGHLLGSGFARQLEPVAYSDWKNHAFIGGSYSYARPAEHAARAALRAPVEGPIAFAGEACSEADFATVHGAWDSGRQAVTELFDTVR